MNKMLGLLAAVGIVSCVASADSGVTQTTSTADTPTPESPPVQTKDDDDVGGDPDTSGSIGSAPPWDYDWSPPACSGSADEPDQDPDTSGDDSAGGYQSSPVSSPVRPHGRSPSIMPLAPCEKSCDEDYNQAAAVCGGEENQEVRLQCQDSAYAHYKWCRGECEKQGEPDCKEQCKKLCDELLAICVKRCRRKPIRQRPECINQCQQQHARCVTECDRKCK